MQTVDRLNHSVRMYVAPIAALALIVLLSIVSYFGLSAQQSALKNIYGVRIQLLKQATEIHAVVNGTHADVYKYLNWILSAYEMNDIENLGKSLQERIAIVRMRLTEFNQSTILSKEEKELVNAALVNVESYERALAEMIEISQIQASMATVFMSTTAQNYDKINVQLTLLRALEDKLSEAAYKQSLTDANWTITANIVGIILAIIVSMTATYLRGRMRTLELEHANALLRKNEIELREARKQAEHISAMKTEFLAVMSHELRTPLSGIIGMINLGLRSQMPTEVKERFTLALRNAESLLTIINDLLDLSKIEVGKLKIEKIDFALAPHIEESLLLLRNKASQKQIEFDIQIDSRLPQYVESDPTRMRQILINLAGNAIKFTEQGGVTVMVNQIKQVENICWIKFEVKDTGMGIEPGAVSRLFQKFEQVDTTTTRKFGGTGLGLAISRQLVELMGGTIGVESQLNVGSNFYFELPLQIGNAPKRISQIQLQPHSHRLSILCAEDFVTNQIIIRGYVEEMGHQIDIVENGEEALYALSEKHYNLVLMDGRMPLMDGVTATRHIRNGHYQQLIFPDPKILIIALTANASENDQAEYLSAGMNNFISKPIDEIFLHQTLAEVIDSLLQKGVSLPANREEKTLAELDDLFGVVSTPPSGATLKTNVATPQKKKTPPIEGSPKKDPQALKAKMYEAFLQDLPKRKKQLESAFTSKDWPNVALLAHGFKGSFGYIWPDAPAIDLCLQLEKAADACMETVCQELYPKLIQELTTIAQNGVVPN